MRCSGLQLFIRATQTSDNRLKKLMCFNFGKSSRSLSHFNFGPNKQCKALKSKLLWAQVQVLAQSQTEINTDSSHIQPSPLHDHRHQFYQQYFCVGFARISMGLKGSCMYVRRKHSASYICMIGMHQGTQIRLARHLFLQHYLFQFCDLVTLSFQDGIQLEHAIIGAVAVVGDPTANVHTTPSNRHTMQFWVVSWILF